MLLLLLLPCLLHKWLSSDGLDSIMAIDLRGTPPLQLEVLRSLATPHSAQTLHDKLLDDGIFQTLVFTRWRTPAIFQQLTKRNITLQPLSYAEIQTKSIRRPDAMRVALSRLSEIDYRYHYPKLYDKFDAVLFWDHWMTPGVESKYLWTKGQICSLFLQVPEGADEGISKQFQRLRHAIEGMSEAPSASQSCTRILVMGGSDTRVSRLPVRTFLEDIRGSEYFETIYYEALDLDLDHIEPMPIGLTDFYILAIPPGTIEAAVRHINLEQKHGILVAWGAVWPALDAKLTWRRELIKWVEKTDWIERQHIPMNAWYGELAKYRFYVVPDGNGVCSPKWAEALLLQTIPIVPPLPYYKKLRRKGYPFVIVDSWDEINETSMNTWWKELSGLLERAAWMHTSQCWWELLSSRAVHVEVALHACIGI